jgi:transposase InsO family protein
LRLFENAASVILQKPSVNVTTPPNLLQQDFAASQPNQKWAGDITYVWTREGWVNLAVILDLHSRRVIALRDLHANPFRVTAGPSAIG